MWERGGPEIGMKSLVHGGAWPLIWNEHKLLRGAALVCVWDETTLRLEQK